MVGFISCIRDGKKVAFVTANNVHGTRNYPVLKFPVHRVIVRVNTTTTTTTTTAAAFGALAPKLFCRTSFFHVRVERELVPVFRIAYSFCRDENRLEDYEKEINVSSDCNVKIIITE